MADKSEGGNHGKTAVLDLLELLLSIFLRRVVEVEGVECTRVSNSDISNNTVGSLLLDKGDTTVLEPSRTGNNLVNGGFRHGGKGLEGVEFRVGINSSVCLDTGEGSEKSGPDESNNGELGDTAVGKLGLTEPLQVAHEVTLNVKGVVEGGEGRGGEANGVESNISGKGSVEGIGRRSERKSFGSLDEVGVKGGGGLAGLGRGECGGRADEEGESGDLHFDIGGE